MIVTTALALGCMLAADPEPRAPAPPPAAAAAHVPGLLDWIAAATGYDVAAARARPPEIVLCRAGGTVRYEGATVEVAPGLRGLYDSVTRRIYLVGPWRAERPRDLSVLLHELVHAVQLDNRAWACLGEPEWEAYKLQERWLAERGIDAEFDWLRIYFLSRCPRDIHP